MKKIALIGVAALFALILILSLVAVLLPSGQKEQPGGQDLDKAKSQEKAWNGQAAHQYNLGFQTPRPRRGIDPQSGKQLEIRRVQFEGLRGIKAGVRVEVVYKANYQDPPAWFTRQQVGRTFTFFVDRSAYRPRARLSKLLKIGSGKELSYVIALRDFPTRFLDGESQLRMQINGVMPERAGVSQPIVVKISADAPPGYEIGDRRKEQLAKIKKARAQAQKKRAKARVQARKKKARARAKARARKKN